MKFILTMLFGCSIAYAQTITYIPINTNDCQLCLTSYKSSKRIDKSLNPVLVFDKIDSASVLYFRNTFMQSNWPFVIDSVLYASLLDELGQTQVHVYNGRKLLFKCLGKLLSENINEINSIKVEEYPDVLKDLNDSIKNRFFGYKTFYRIKDEVLIHSRISNRFLIYNVKNGNIKTYLINDSQYYNFVNIEDFNNLKSKEKRIFYKKAVGDELDEFVIDSYCYFDDMLYLYVAVIDYSKMLDREQLEKENNEIVKKSKYYILEFKPKENNVLELTYKIELDRNSKNVKYGYRFWIVNDTPSFLYTKEINSEKYNWYMNLKSKKMENYLEFKKENLLFNPFSGNTVYNQYTYNRLTNTLIDNVNDVAMKFSNFGYDTMMFYDLFSVDSSAYLVLKDMLSQKLLIYKVDTKNKQSKIIATYDNMSKTNRYFFSWYDPNKKIITVYGFKDPFTIYKLGTIEH